MGWIESFRLMEAGAGTGKPLSVLFSQPWVLVAVLGTLALLLGVVSVLLLLSGRRRRSGMRTQQGTERPASACPAGSIQIGKVHGQGARSYQQDSFGISAPELFSENGLLAVVADGMGGLQDGDRLSTAVVETVLDGFSYSQGQGTPEQVLLTLTQWSVREVNRMLGPDRYRSGGTTMAMGMIRGGYFAWASVGDSRISLYRGGQLIQLNREHDLKQKLAVQAVNGEIPLQEVYTDKRRDALVSFVGMGPLDQIDLPSTPLKLLPGDQLIIMTDGVYNALEEGEICQALSKGVEQAAGALEQAIQEKGYPDQDNYTAVILSFETDNRPAGRRSARRKRERSEKR